MTRHTINDVRRSEDEIWMHAVDISNRWRTLLADYERLTDEATTMCIALQAISMPWLWRTSGNHMAWLRRMLTHDNRKQNETQTRNWNG